MPDQIQQPPQEQLSEPKILRLVSTTEPVDQGDDYALGWYLVGGSLTGLLAYVFALCQGPGWWTGNFCGLCEAAMIYFFVAAWQLRERLRWPIDNPEDDVVDDADPGLEATVALSVHDTDI